MNLPTRCIQISPNGPITQGPCAVETVRVFQTGKREPTGRGTIDNCGITYRGPLVGQHWGEAA